MVEIEETMADKEIAGRYLIQSLDFSLPFPLGL
jgi:hypothetical protein